jgi:hypothetical protein
MESSLGFCLVGMNISWWQDMIFRLTALNDILLQERFTIPYQHSDGNFSSMDRSVLRIASGKSLTSLEQ